MVLNATSPPLPHSRGGLRPNDFSSAPLPCWIGRVDGVEAAPLAGRARRVGMPQQPACLAWPASGRFPRSARLAARQRYGAARIALLLGTSTASIGATEEAYRRLDARWPHAAGPAAPADPCPAFAGGLRRRRAWPGRPLPDHLHGMLVQRQGVCQRRADDPARPGRCRRRRRRRHPLRQRAVRLQRAGAGVAANRAGRSTQARDGISIGEAAGFALLERIDVAPRSRRDCSATAKSSDAHHMSTPHPEGLGAELALARRPRLAPACTRTRSTTSTCTARPARRTTKSKPRWSHRDFSGTTRASSTKGFTGHTLGAAGIVEAVFALLAIEHGLVPGNLGCDDARSALRSAVRLAQRAAAHRRGAEQLVRLRRQQRLPGLRAGRVRA